MSMNVTVSFVGFFKLGHVASGQTLSVADGTSIASLLDGYGVGPRQQWRITAAVNGEEQKLSYVLRDGDRLDLFMPLGGG